MDEDYDYITDELPVFAVLGDTIAKLAAVHSTVKDQGMADIVHDAAMICLREMIPPEPKKADLLVFTGGKPQ